MTVRQDPGPSSGDRAALYLRMSTDMQTYSLDHQRAALETYAATHGLQIVRTYEDAARSGLGISARPGLSSLIADVLSGCPYETVLVYDVSRWGRFQDSDEAGYYEFLCRANGVSVHYCAEGFEGQAGLSASLMKAVKRVMAAEYSRELSKKVAAGHLRLFNLGFHQGGPAILGFRRRLVGADGGMKAELQEGERKAIHSDRVVLCVGPEPEQKLVRRIFRMRVIERLSAQRIADVLNAEGSCNARGRPWRQQTVSRVLRSELYVGVATLGRTYRPLGGRQRINPELARHKRVQAFSPMIDPALFRKAQRLLKAHPRPLAGDEIIIRLRALLAREGDLSVRLIDKDPETPSACTVARRFGGLAAVYASIGYIPPNPRGPRGRARTTSRRQP